MTDYANNLIGATLEQELGDSFGRYARATILARAIPDVRDGLKPVQRRIVYAMYLAKNGPDQRYRKCAKTVGEVMGSFHPHGDQSIYDALVRLAQSWKLRAMLVDGHGNFGSIDDDPPAAMRYTEARLAPIAVELTRDIEKNTVKFQPNFDDSTHEPTVLPSKYPNLLVNGTSGVSTGFSTEIQPHNLGECIDALVAMIENPEIDLDQVMTFIKGPDFPTGGVLPGLDDLRKAYETGKGRVVLRARTEIEKTREGSARIVVHEIPYGVVKSNLVRDLEKLRTDKVVQGIKDVRDETDREGLRIVIDLARGVAAEPVQAFLFKKTDLQVYRHFQMVAIVDQSPMQLGLLEILRYYLEHQQDVVTRRSRHDLERAQRRLHLVEGLIRAIDVLDEVIAIIRAANDRADAHQKLMARFDFTDDQTREILDLRLHRLTNLQILQLQEEQAALEKEIAKLERILGSHTVLMNTIKKELLAVRETYADDRRTTILEHVEDIDDKIRVTVTVKEQPVVIGVSRDGYIKRSGVTSFEKTGGTAESSGVKEDDVMRWPLHSNTLHHALVLTERGKAFTLPVHEIPEARWGDNGTAIVNVVAFDKDDRVVDVLNIESFDTEDQICFVTRKGSMKRTTLKDLQSQRSTGVTTMKLSGDDVIVRTLRTDGSGHVLVATREGNCIRFPMEEVSVQGRNAGGVRGIRLPTRDRVVDCTLLPADDDGEVAIITEEGKAKRTALEFYPAQRRGGRGVRCVRKRQRLPHRVAAAIWWPDAATDTEEVRLLLSDLSLETRAVSEMSNAARDGNGYEFVSPPLSVKVMEAYRLHRAQPNDGDPDGSDPDGSGPDGGADHAETGDSDAEGADDARSTAEEAGPATAAAAASEADDGRGDWTRSSPAFLPGMTPAEPDEADDAAEDDENDG